MIRLPDDNEPSEAWRARAADALERLRAHEGSQRARPTEPGVYHDPEVLQALLAMTSEKCSYCESELAGLYPQVDHYRPKGGVAGVPDHPGYWWLAYDWDNLLVTCQVCNHQKGARFPLADESERAREPGAERGEAPLLLNPRADRPDEHLVFRADGTVNASRGSTRGQASIEVCRLNHPLLVSNRFRFIDDLRATLRELQSEATFASAEMRLRQYVSGDRRYAQLARQFFRNPAAFLRA